MLLPEYTYRAKICDADATIGFSPKYPLESNVASEGVEI